MQPQADNQAPAQNQPAQQNQAPAHNPPFATSHPINAPYYGNPYAHPGYQGPARITPSVTHPQPIYQPAPITHPAHQYAPIQHAPGITAPLSHAPIGTAPLGYAPYRGGPIPAHIAPPMNRQMECDRRLVNLLCAIQEGESDIEACRQRLCSIPDFSLNAAFQIFDHDQDGVISANEVCTFLKENKSKECDEADCADLVEYFDATGDNVLTYNEFSQILLPCEDNVLRNVTLDRSQKAQQKLDILPGDIAEGITSVFEKEIEFAKRLNHLKCELLALESNCTNTYRCMDKNQSGVVDTVNLGGFIGGHGKQLNDMDLLAIIRRIDTNGDATIDLNEWVEFLKVKKQIAKPMAAPIHTMGAQMHMSRPGMISRVNQPILTHTGTIPANRIEPPTGVHPRENLVNSQPGYHYEVPVTTIDYEPVTRMESVPVTKQVQVPVQRMESREVNETVQVPVTRMETRTETRTEMVPMTVMEDQEYKWTEQIPVTKMEEKLVTHIEQVPVTIYQAQEVQRLEQVPVTVYETQEFSRIEKVPVTVMEPKEYPHEVQYPVTHMEDRTTTRVEQYPVTEMVNQEVIEHQQVEKTDYVAIEKTSYQYYGQTDVQRGQAVGTVEGETRHLGTTHVETLPIRTNPHMVATQYTGHVAAHPTGVVQTQAAPVMASHVQPGYYHPGYQGAPIGYPGATHVPYPHQQFTHQIHSPERIIRHASPSRSHDFSRAMDQRPSNANASQESPNQDNKQE